MNQKTLTDKGLSAAKWNYAGNAVRLGLQFAVGILLARLLGPEAFGTVAIAWLMIGVGMLFADFGFSAALIQKKDLKTSDIDFAFTIQILVGALLTALCALLAHPIAVFFKQPEATDIIRAMSALFLIRAAGQTATALINREINYKTTQLIGILTYAVGYLLVGIPCAYLGLKAWSLVAAQLTQSLCYTVAIIGVLRRPLRLRFYLRDAGIVRFGGAVTGSNIASWIVLNVDGVIIGHTLGAYSLGIYNRAVTLIGTPAMAASTSLQGVLFSSCARAQGDLAKIKGAYLAATAALALACFPIFGTAAIVPDAIVLAVYGDAWSKAIPILTPLSLAMAVHVFLATIGPVLSAINQPKREFVSQVTTALIMPPVLFIAAQRSLEAIAWAVLVVYSLRASLLFCQLRRALHIRWTELGTALTWPVILTASTILFALAVDRIALHIAPAPRLLAIIAACGVALLLLLRGFGPQVSTGLGPYGPALARKLPSVARRWARLDHTTTSQDTSC